MPARLALDVVTGPDVLIVIVEVATVPLTVTFGGLNEHTGGMVTSGVIVLHESVTPPGGLAYPLIALMLITPSPPLPAVTLLGVTAFCTVMVN